MGTSAASTRKERQGEQLSPPQQQQIGWLSWAGSCHLGIHLTSTSKTTCWAGRKVAQKLREKRFAEVVLTTQPEHYRLLVVIF